MNPIEQAEHKVAGWFRQDTEESTVTETAASADTAGPDQSTASFWGMLHHNVDLFTGSMERFLPKLKAIATNAPLDDGVDALIGAFAGPMAAEVFDAVIALLKAEPADQESAAFDLLKAVVHQPAKSTAMAEFAEAGAEAARKFVAAEPSFTPAQQQAAQAAAPAVAQAVKPMVV